MHTTTQLRRTEPQHTTERTCLVTGGSRGIGRAIAMALARDGANVVVNYRSSAAAAEEVATAVDEVGGTGLTVGADVGDPRAVESMVEQVHETFGSVDVLVNNAGVTVDGRFEEMTTEDWRRVLEVNLGGAFNCAKACYEDVRDADEGRLINVSSVVGQRGNFGQANYAASKSALFGFTRSLAHELAPYGSTANCVAPGYTRTDMVEPVPDSIQEDLREEIPLGRFADPDEVAAAVRFLATEDASYVTGETLNVNGGLFG